MRMGDMAMNCAKCGREITEDQVFCESCRTEMEQYPVKPGTVIFLPSQMKDLVKKPVSKKKPIPTPEEQVPILKRKLRRTRVLAFLMTLVIAFLMYVCGRVVTELDIQRLLGQNYSTIETEPDETYPTGETPATAEMP